LPWRIERLQSQVMTKTKLVATVGPACDTDAHIGAMVDVGVDVFRLNFSHGTLDTHAASLERIRRIAAERGEVVAVMGDLCGPKIRLGQVAGGQCELVAGTHVVFQREPIDGTPQRLSCNYPALIEDAKKGDRVLIDDGNVLLRVIDKKNDELVCRCEIGGVVSNHKGINLPDSNVSAPALTEKDRTDLEWAIRHQVDLIALSFVRQPEDIVELRTILTKQGSSAQIVAKIEKPQALEQLDRIIQESDVVLVARGDLGVEMDISRVPIVQKEIALHCRLTGTPVIIATQMLQSMVESPVPTRAEVSDIANAILDNADALMLSAETSIGRFPIEAVRVMDKVAAQTDSFSRRHSQELGINRTATLRVATAVVHAATAMAEDLDVGVVAVWTEGGNLARLLSKHRLDRPIVAFTPHEHVCRQMALLYGVIPIRYDRPSRLDRMLNDLDQTLIDRDLATHGDRIVVVANRRPDLPGDTEALLTHIVGSGKSNDSGAKGVTQ